MITYQEEKLHDCLVALDTMIMAYWYATPENKDHEPLEFNWRAFCELEVNNNLVLWTARENGEVVGCVIYFVVDHLHHNNYKYAICDTLATAISHRGKGIAAELIARAETTLRCRGVRVVVHMFRHVYSNEPLFPKLEFEAYETAYRKELK